MASIEKRLALDNISPYTRKDWMGPLMNIRE